jgi:hypothetical protein
LASLIILLAHILFAAALKLPKIALLYPTILSTNTRALSRLSLNSL